MIIYYIFVFLLGAIIGSFLNVVIFRHNTGEQIVSGRSRCFSCGKGLKWYELVPIGSFVFQKGKCRGCSSKISVQYPLVELTTASLFLAVFYFFTLNGLAGGSQFLQIGYYWLIFSLLIVIAVYDIRHQIIPNSFVYSFIALAFFQPVISWVSMNNFIRNFDLSGLIAGVSFFLFFAALWWFSKGRAMGFGDAKLSLGIGFLLGVANGLAALLFAFWSGAIVGIFLLVLSKKSYNMKSKIAFGPFLVFGAITAFFFGNMLINAYFLY